jgi:hypothetical protein
MIFVVQENVAACMCGRVVFRHIRAAGHLLVKYVEAVILMFSRARVTSQRVMRTQRILASMYQNPRHVDVLKASFQAFHDVDRTSHILCQIKPCVISTVKLMSSGSMIQQFFCIF